MLLCIEPVLGIYVNQPARPNTKLATLKGEELTTTAKHHSV